MGLEVAEVLEFAALRPIQTAAVTGAMATAGGADHHDAAAVNDTRCVTPKASRAGAAACAADDDAAPATATDGTGSATPTATGPMAALPPPDSGADDTSYATPTTCRTIPPLDGLPVGEATVSFTTPTSEDSALRPATVCPPAPRKLAPALKRKLAPLQQRLFYPVPRDLASVFMPAPPPAAKKMRVAHAVESSLPLGT